MERTCRRHEPRLRSRLETRAGTRADWREAAANDLAAAGFTQPRRLLSGRWLRRRSAAAARADVLVEPAPVAIAGQRELGRKREKTGGECDHPMHAPVSVVQSDQDATKLSGPVSDDMNLAPLK